MKFDLAISRVATFAHADFKSSPPNPLKGDELYAAFRDVAERIAAHPQFLQANDSIRAIAARADQRANLLPAGSPESEDGIAELAVLNPASEFGDARTELAGTEPFIARMESERLKICLAGMTWILRTRASITSCALEGNVRPTKLWWTFEGIPQTDDPLQRPDSAQLAALLGVVRDMEAGARTGLLDAYKDVFRKSVSPRGSLESENKRLSITMAECVDREVDALFDAMYFDSRSFSELRHAESEELSLPRQGAQGFESFIHEIAGYDGKIDEGSIRLTHALPKVRGILWHHSDSNQHVVAGFARRVGRRAGFGLLNREELKQEMAEDRVRRVSAARPLSALVANTRTAELDRLEYA